MKVLRPNPMTPAKLVSTTAADAHPAYASGTTYAQGQLVTYQTGSYESLVNSNTGHTPDVSPTFWLRTGPSNSYAMFDNQISTQTAATGPLVATVACGVSDAVYLGNIIGTGARITVRNGLGGPILYQQEQNLQGEGVGDWYQYFFFDATAQHAQAVFQGIPSFGSSHLTIEILGSGQVGLGIVLFGPVREIGSTALGANAGIIDYSRKETDDFGATTFVRRAYSKRLSAQVLIENLQLNRVQRLLYDLRATPAVWLGVDDETFEEPMTVFGFYRDFQTTIAYPKQSLCSLEIEGLI